MESKKKEMKNNCHQENEQKRKIKFLNSRFAPIAQQKIFKCLSWS